MWKFLKSSKDDSVDDSIQFITTPGEFGGTCVNDQPPARRKWWFFLSTVPSHFYSGYNLQTCNLLFSFRLKLSSLIPLCWSFPRKLSKLNCCDLARGSSHPFQFRIQFYQLSGVQVFEYLSVGTISYRKVASLVSQLHEADCPSLF